MKILLFTDIHVGPDTIYLKNTNSPELGKRTSTFGTLFEKYSSKLREEISNSDLAFMLGDAISDSNESKIDEENLEKAVNLTKTKTPIHFVIGNHDVKNISKERIKEITGNNNYYSFDFGGYHHIILDGSPSWAKGSNEISETQYNWLKDDLNSTKLKCIIYCHFPLDNQKMDENRYFKEIPERASISNKVFIRNLLRATNKTIAVFSGHTHNFSVQNIDGIFYYTIPSFLENNENNEPTLEYAECILDGDNIEVEIKVLEK